jgi:ferrochelatase
MAVDTQPARTTGVLLMTYGAAKSPEDVPEYLSSVYRGNAPREVVEEFQRRYRLVGGSPLIEITRAQARALQELLNSEAGPDERYLVEAGMQHTPPFIAEALEKLADAGCERVLAIVLSPQYSPIIMGGYGRKLDAARREAASHVEVTVAGTWHTLPSFVEALAARVREALDRLPPDARATAPVILTAHSLPESVVAREPHYIEQLLETVRAVADRAGLEDGRWQFAYQSAGHSPEPWLKPDMKDLLPGLKAQGHDHVLMVPVQFLADHLETLYDIDVGAREEADEVGIGFHRIEMFNAAPDFIRVLAEVVHRELAAAAAPHVAAAL